MNLMLLKVVVRDSRTNMVARLRVVAELKEETELTYPVFPAEIYAVTVKMITLTTATYSRESLVPVLKNMQSVQTTMPGRMDVKKNRPMN